MGLHVTGPDVLKMTEDEVRNRPAYERIKSLPNAKVSVDDVAHALGAMPVSSIGQIMKPGCDIVSPYVSESPDNVHYEFRPPPTRFF